MLSGPREQMLECTVCLLRSWEAEIEYFRLLTDRVENELSSNSSVVPCVLIGAETCLTSRYVATIRTQAPVEQADLIFLQNKESVLTYQLACSV
jgi:hypothetical protein